MNLSVLLKALIAVDEHGRAHCLRLRRELRCITPATSTAPANSRCDYRPDATLLPHVLARLRDCHQQP